MGQKVSPTGIRLGIATDWASKWYANSKNFPDLLETDLKVRQFLKKKLANASVSRIQIERPARLARITVHTARPGVVIGKKGEDIEALRKAVARMMRLDVKDLQINIEEIRKPELDAQLVAEGVAQQLERRIMFRRAMKRSVTNAMRLGALGIVVEHLVAGHLVAPAVDHRRGEVLGGRAGALRSPGARAGERWPRLHAGWTHSACG